MLNQIELYQSIPKTRKTIHGFIDETRVRLADCTPTEYSLKRKYQHRLDQAEKALFALNQLHGCLNE